jgi:hypothetical protein
LLGSDAAAARAQSLLDHEDVIDKKLRFVFPRIKFFRCSADARDVFDDETTQNHANLRGGGGGGGGLSSSTSSFLSGLGGSLINNNSSSYLQVSSSTQHAQKSESSVVNLNFRLSAPPVVVKTSVTAASVTSGSAGGGGGGGGGGGRSSDSSGPPPSLTLDDLMADVMRYPGGGSTTAGTVSQDSSPLAHCSVNGSSSSMLSASTTAGLPLGGPLQLFSSFQGGGFAPSPFSAAFSTLSLLAPPPSSSLSQNNILMESSVLMTNESSISTDCGECKRSLALTPIAIVDAQWGAGASPGAKRRDKQAQSLSLYGSSSSKGGGGEIITVKCGKCKVSFHAECVGLSVALDRWNCQSCMWR